jgi:hypothetical protein
VVDRKRLRHSLEKYRFAGSFDPAELRKFRGRLFVIVKKIVPGYELLGYLLRALRSKASNGSYAIIIKSSIVS